MENKLEELLLQRGIAEEFLKENRDIIKEITNKLYKTLGKYNFERICVPTIVYVSYLKNGRKILEKVLDIAKNYDLTWHIFLALTEIIRFSSFTEEKKRRKYSIGCPV